MCHNIGTLASVLPEELKPRFAQCVERILSSQDPLISNSAIGLEVKSLQPGTVVCSEGSGGSVSGSGSGSSTTLTTQFLSSVAVREKKIETEVKLICVGVLHFCTQTYSGL